MPTITVKETFKFAERGVDIFEYKQGEIVEVSDECAAVAKLEGWAVDADSGVKGTKKTRPAPDIVDEAFVKQEADLIASLADSQ